MSGRDDLLAAAKHCLVHRGWGATTVRDVADAAGMAHGAIGYHFGSRDALMTEALIAAVTELEKLDGSGDTGTTRPQQWQALLDTATTHRELWLAQLEAVRQAQPSAEIRHRLVAGQQQAQRGLGGAAIQALLLGLVVQRLVDHDTALTAQQALDELKAVDTGESEQPPRPHPDQDRD